MLQNQITRTITWKSGLKPYENQVKSQGKRTNPALFALLNSKHLLRLKQNSALSILDLEGALSIKNVTNFNDKIKSSLFEKMYY